MKYKINNINEIPELLDKVKSYLVDFLENNGMLEDYDKYPVEDVAMIMFKDVMDVETCFKLLNILEHSFQEVGYLGLDKRLWWFLKFLAWDVDKEAIENILNCRFVEDEKEKISSLVTAPVENQEKKRI
ncbi:TPA: hypothetical protein ACTAD5_004590 [Salmonella enterica subsp. enterica serovar Virchow]